jgi:hypothetical protein
MQHPDDDPGDHRAEDPGVDRRNADNILDVVRFEDAASVVGRMPFAVSQKLTARFITA